MPATPPAKPTTCAARWRHGGGGHAAAPRAHPHALMVRRATRRRSSTRSSSRSRGSGRTDSRRATRPVRQAGLHQLLAEAPRARGLRLRAAQCAADGLYSPSQIVQDARRGHGGRARWRCVRWTSRAATGIARWKAGRRGARWRATGGAVGPAPGGGCRRPPRGRSSPRARNARSPTCATSACAPGWTPGAPRAGRCRCAGRPGWHRNAARWAMAGTSRVARCCPAAPTKTRWCCPRRHLANRCWPTTAALASPWARTRCPCCARGWRRSA